MFRKYCAVKGTVRKIVQIKFLIQKTFNPSFCFLNKFQAFFQWGF